MLIALHKNARTNLAIRSTRVRQFAPPNSANGLSKQRLASNFRISCGGTLHRQIIEIS